MPRADGSLRLINPLRECVRLELPLKSPDLNRVVSAGLKLLSKAGRYGTGGWPEVESELRFQVVNLVEILTMAPRVEPIAKLMSVIECARLLTVDDNRIAPSAFVELARNLGGYPISQSAIARALLAAGDLSTRRDELDGAKTQLEEARVISTQIGDDVGQAAALNELGDLALQRDVLKARKRFRIHRRDLRPNRPRLGEAMRLRRPRMSRA